MNPTARSPYRGDLNKNRPPAGTNPSKNEIEFPPAEIQARLCLALYETQPPHFEVCWTKDPVFKMGTLPEGIF